MTETHPVFSDVVHRIDTSCLKTFDCILKLSACLNYSKDDKACSVGIFYLNVIGVCYFNIQSSGWVA